MEPEFPLFVNPAECLSVFEKNPNFKEILYLCSHIHYSGSPCFNMDEYAALVEGVDSRKLKRIESNFIFKGDKVYFRGNNYYLGGKHTPPHLKIDLMHNNIANIDELLHAVVEDKNLAQKTIITSSLYDHLKHYFMLIFNGLYKKCLNEKNRDEGILQIMDICYLYTDFYYKSIIQNQLNTHNIDINIKEMSRDLPEYLDNELAFYREMDNPSRILLHASNIISNSDKEYNLVVNPLSGAAELGFALKSISCQLGKKIVKNILPMQYSFYQDSENEVVDLFSLIDKTLAGPLLKFLPLNKNDPILIFDDNISSGGTLLVLQNLFKQKYEDVDITAVEARTLYYGEFDMVDARTSKELIGALKFRPIGETRRNMAIHKFINDHLLK